MFGKMLRMKLMFITLFISKQKTNNKNRLMLANILLQ